MHGGQHRIDVEWLALAGGIKPAIRVASSALEATAIAARFQKLGAAVATARGPVGVHRHEQTLVYVARTAGEAASLRAAERPLLAAHLPARDKAYYAGELGLRLGYPRCCVDAFAARVLRGPGKLRTGDRDAVHEDYVAARDALLPLAGGRPDWRLNNLLLRQHIRLVTFEPCRYDCASALAIAAPLLKIVDAHHPEAAAVLRASLQRPLALASTGARAWVAGDAARITAAEPPRERPGAAPDPADAGLAARLLVLGRIAPADPPTLLLDFTPP